MKPMLFSGRLGNEEFSLEPAGSKRKVEDGLLNSKYPPAKPGALAVSRSKRPWTWPLRGHLRHPTGGHFIPTGSNLPTPSRCRHPGGSDQDHPSGTAQPPRFLPPWERSQDRRPARAFDKLEELGIPMSHRLHCGRPSWGLPLLMLERLTGEFPALLPELSNSGCRPGKAGGSPPFTLV